MVLHGFLLFFLCLTCMPFIHMQVRRGTLVSNEEILGFAKLFNDELTLDNISRLSSWLLGYMKNFSSPLFQWYQIPLGCHLDCDHNFSAYASFAAIRPRLLSMCKYMGIDTKLFKFSFTDAHLRYMLRKRLQRWDTCFDIISNFLFFIFAMISSFLYETRV